jgi:hypothetical protein
MTRAQMKRAAMALSDVFGDRTWATIANDYDVPPWEIDGRSPRFFWGKTIGGVSFADEASILLTEAHAPSHEPSTRSQEEWSRDSKTRAMG